MPKFLLATLAGLLLVVSCAPPKALDSLVPANALVVVYVEHPLSVAKEFLALGKALESGLPPGLANPLSASPALLPEFPLDVLDLNRPLAAALLPFTGTDEPGVPTVAVYLPLKDEKSLAFLQPIAARQGLTAHQLGGSIGNWAVLTTPGAPVPMVLPAGKFFDLGRARLPEERGIAVFVDLKNALASTVVPEELQAVFPLLAAVETEVAGVLLGVYATPPELTGSALRVTFQAELKPTSKALAVLHAGKPARLEDWAPWLDDRALVALAADLPRGTSVEAETLASVADPLLRRHLQNLRDLVGPRVAFNLTGGLDPESEGPEFVGVLEAPDPHALRQALKSLIASGSLQENFLQFALDADTPLVYQDSPGGPLGLRSRLSLGPFAVNLAWGNGKAYFASGKDFAALDALVTAGRAVTTWKGLVPPGSRLLASANPVAWKLVPGTTANSNAGSSAPGAVHASLTTENGVTRAQLWWGTDGLRSVLGQALQLLPALLGAARP